VFACLSTRGGVGGAPRRSFITRRAKDVRFLDI